MPNTPAQFPNYDLPGAEWFSLAPNANIALQGRRRARIPSVGTPYTTLNPNTTGTNQVTVLLEDAFTPTSGIYIHHGALVFTTSASGLPVLFPTKARFCVGLRRTAVGNASFDGQFDLGQSSGQQGVIISVQDKLLTQRDIATAYDTVAPSGALTLSFQVDGASTNATQQNFFVFGYLIYTRLDGLTE